MKRFLLLLVCGVCSGTLFAQEKSTEAPKTPGAHAESADAHSEEVRVKALEEEVRTLVEQVAQLRGEVRALREARVAEPQRPDRLLLASTSVDPGILAPASAAPAASASAVAAEPAPNPAPPQMAQTQTYGGATSNAKLLNPDISLIGDFIGTAGRNTVSPSRSLELHESEVGMQAIIDWY